MSENVIEWLTGSDTISVTLNQKKYINKVRTLEKKHKNLVKIIENKDGSIFARLPLKALKLSIITATERNYQNLFKRKDDAHE